MGCRNKQDAWNQFGFGGCPSVLPVQVVELVACLLDALLILPLLVSLAILAIARGILSLASLPSIKVSISVRATCEDPENRMDTKTNKTNEQV